MVKSTAEAMSPVKSSMYTEFNVHSTFNTPWVGMAMRRPIVPNESQRAQPVNISPAIFSLPDIRYRPRYGRDDNEYLLEEYIEILF
jgi:hypothetical protein